jgi:hypothetical protein
MGCRNTVFNAAAQSAAYHLPRLMQAGYRTLRVEFVDEKPEHVAPVLEGYRAAATGALAPSKLWQVLARVPDGNGRLGGVGGGSLDVRGERAAGDLRPTAAALKEAARTSGGGGGGGDGGSGSGKSKSKTMVKSGRS